MRKIFICFILMFGMMNIVSAENFPNLKYKNIGLKDKISYDIQTNTWSKKIDKKNKNYFVKVKGFGDFYDYLDADKNFAFSTNCEYEFIYNNTLIGYSNRDLKFYEIIYDNNTIGKRALTIEETEALLPDYKIISLSEFSPKTNAFKIKRGSSPLKIFIYNDTENTFDNYTFFSGNSKFEQYDLKGFLTVQTPGMIQFSRTGEQNSSLWYVILVR